MPKRSSACDSSSIDRSLVAEELYIAGGASDASRRCDINDRLGKKDLFAELAGLLRIGAEDVVVDVCCGAGQQTVKFAALCLRSIGFDFSNAAVEEARARGADAHVADAASLPLPDGSVDALCCSFGIYYLESPGKAIREWRRVLKPGGRIAICGPARGTNVELYDFHLRATGEGPSDADTMAWGYVDDVVLPELMASGFSDVTAHAFVNPIEFPTAAAFLEYWCSTSLFLRSRNATAEAGAQLLATHEGAFRVTKRVSIATAVRS